MNILRHSAAMVALAIFAFVSMGGLTLAANVTTAFERSQAARFDHVDAQAPDSAIGGR